VPRVLAALALIALAGLPGCGGTVIDTSKIEATLQHSLESERREKVSSVDCPSGQKVQPKATFRCTVNLAGGKTETATLEIRDSKADVSVIRIEEEGRSGQ
jgi:hypothetical protein